MWLGGHADRRPGHRRAGHADLRSLRRPRPHRRPRRRRRRLHRGRLRGWRRGRRRWRPWRWLLGGRGGHRCGDRRGDRRGDRYGRIVAGRRFPEHQQDHRNHDRGQRYPAGDQQDACLRRPVPRRRHRTEHRDPVVLVERIESTALRGLGLRPAGNRSRPRTRNPRPRQTRRLRRCRRIPPEGSRSAPRPPFPPPLDVNAPTWANARLPPTRGGDRGTR